MMRGAVSKGKKLVDYYRKGRSQYRQVIEKVSQPWGKLKTVGEKTTVVLGTGGAGSIGYLLAYMTSLSEVPEFTEEEKLCVIKNKALDVMEILWRESCEQSLIRKQKLQSLASQESEIDQD
ncbi:unnamed protein product [Cochlearia groenlandica]